MMTKNVQRQFNKHVAEIVYADRDIRQKKIAEFILSAVVISKDMLDAIGFIEKSEGGSDETMQMVNETQRFVDYCEKNIRDRFLECFGTPMIPDTLEDN